MIWRVLVTLAGVCVVAAATHANVLHVGGYRSADAPMIITLAVLLSVGMGFCAVVWRAKQRFGAVVLGVCILSGEAYWVLTNTEREIAVREVRDAPTLRALEARTDAEKLVEKAEKALKDANGAVTTEAAKKDCLKNCAAMLTAAAVAAREELTAARTALTNTPRPLSPAPLPARLGIAPWLWDLVMAGLRSLAVVGGSIAIGLAPHKKREGSVQATAADVLSKSTTSTSPKSLSSKKRAAPKQITFAGEVKSARNHAAEFGVKCMQPDPEGETAIRQMHDRYRIWCDETGRQRLPPSELARELGALFSQAGLPVEDRGNGKLIVRGVRLV